MANPKDHKNPESDDQRPDAWERFERAVDAALHTPPKHRSSASKKKKPPKRKATHKGAAKATGV